MFNLSASMMFHSRALRLMPDKINQKGVLLIVVSLGCLTYTVQNDVRA